VRVPYNRGMRILVLALVGVCIGNGRALAETSGEGEVAATVEAVRAASQYPALTRGQVLFVNGQRLVVTQELPPVATVEEAPPEPLVDEVDQPPVPYEGAIWVESHWAYAATGFTWVTGRYIAARRGYVFVPPRWAFLEDQYFYFTGFYVPYNVYVRSHFNRYYYSGVPTAVAGSTRGPYWPVGAPAAGSSALTSARARDPYWPIGARR